MNLNSPSGEKKQENCCVYVLFEAYVFLLYPALLGTSSCQHFPAPFIVKRVFEACRVIGYPFDNLTAFITPFPEFRLRYQRRESVLSASEG
jgi:hypothetical protein